MVSFDSVSITTELCLSPLGHRLGSAQDIIQPEQFLILEDTEVSLLGLLPESILLGIFVEAMAGLLRIRLSRVYALFSWRRLMWGGAFFVNTHTPAT